MIDLLASFAINLTEFWIFLLLMQYVCGAHLYFSRKNVVLCSLFSLGTTLLAVLLESFHILPFVSLFCMPLAIFLSVLLCSLNRTDFFRYIPAFALYFILAFIPERILLILIPSLNAHFVLPDSHLTVTAVLSDLILLAFLLLLQRVLTRYQISMQFSVRETIGSIGLVFFAIIDVMLLLLLDRGRMTAVMYYIWAGIFIGMLLFGIGYYLYNLLEARVRLSQRITAENEIRYLNMQLEALKDMQENEEQLKKLRHDLSNHLEIIQNLCGEGNYDDAKRYIGELHEKISFSWNNTLSGNNIHSDSSMLSDSNMLSDNNVPSNNNIASGSKTADLVLNNKRKLAEQYGIAFSFEGSLEKLENMRKPDLCSLLSNAYDNAIEACRNLENPYIRTKAHTTRNYTVIQITNPTAQKIRIRRGHIATTKKDTSAHGYGTKIMQEIALRYHGSCVYSCTEQEFTVKITLLNETSERSL